MGTRDMDPTFVDLFAMYHRLRYYQAQLLWDPNGWGIKVREIFPDFFRITAVIEYAALAVLISFPVLRG